MPVFARLAGARGQLADAYAWATRMLGRITFPVCVVLCLVAADLAPLLPAGDDGSYAEAAMPMAVLAVAALMRSHYLLFPPLLQSIGFPGIALRFGLAALALFGAAISLCLYFWQQTLGVTAVALAWVMVYPPLLWAASVCARDLVGIRPTRMMHAVGIPALGAMFAALSGLGVRMLAFDWAGLPRIGFVAGAVIGVFVLSQWLLERTHSGRLPEPPGESDSTPSEAPGS